MSSFARSGSRAVLPSALCLMLAGCGGGGGGGTTPTSAAASAPPTTPSGTTTPATSDGSATATPAPSPPTVSIAGFAHVAPRTVSLAGVTFYKSSLNDPDYGLMADATGAVQRFEIHAGDAGYSGDVTRARDRYELVTLRDGSQPQAIFPRGADIWIAFSFMVEPGAALTAPYVVTGQLHNMAGDDLPTASPPLYFQIVQSDAATVTYSLRTRGTADAAAIASAPGAVQWSTTLPRGQWIAMVVHVQSSDTGAGRLEAWANGVQVVDRTGLTIGYPDPVGDLYWQYGLYRPTEPNPLAARYANMEVSGSSLLARVNSPLEVPVAAR